jgi:DNA-binding CsgD family transcriptional regulator
MDDEPIISLHDPHGIVLWINKAPDGVTPAEVVGTTPWHWVADEHKARVKAYFATCIALGDQQHFQQPAIVKGNVIQLDVRIDPTGGTKLPIIARTRVIDSRISLLTPREKEVSMLTAEGLSAKQIGRRLGISGSTVDTHRSRIRAKLGLRTIADVALFAMRNLHD